MNVVQKAIRFRCHDAWLYGILSLPEQAISRGVLVVVGGPQYRVGSHRQFALLANDLAAHGVPVMRFDYRGMGDSEGDARTFEAVEEDIRHAIDQFVEEVPAVTELVIWGLCDAASAALFYAHQDQRVRGLVLLNPWVRTDEGMAKAYLKHYYLARLTDRELWGKIIRGKFDYAAAVRSISSLLGKVMPGRSKSAPASEPAVIENPGKTASLPERMFDGLGRFKGNVLLIMSGNDLTAKEFSDLVNASRKWQKLLRSARVQRRDLPEANHTFSQRDWRNQVSSWTRDWIASW